MTGGGSTLPRLLLLTDRTQLPEGRDLVATVRRCVEVGLRAVVVREHDLEPAEREEMVEELCESAPELTVLSSRVPVAAARGTHLASHQLPGTGWWGRSCHGRVDVARAVDQGASWVTLSPFAPTPSKPGHGPALEPDVFADHALPVFALGGISARNAPAARDAGAYGVAVMGAVMRHPRPEHVVGALVEVLR